ncbi:MAG TPA: hypothetical protein ENK04_13075 [Gammaproteobacteria bacterium]|nr:hypothetical protein [Gammaproteobacteria bacterium]
MLNQYIDLSLTKHITQSQLPTGYSTLLDHDDYMTLRISQLKNCTLSITKMFQEVSPDNILHRCVILNDDNGTAYIAAFIEIYLENLPLDVRETLIHSNKPLGKILIERNIHPKFSNRKYLLTKRECILVPYLRDCIKMNHLYGRFHSLLTASGEKIADVHEFVTHMERDAVNQVPSVRSMPTERKQEVVT